MSDNSLRIWKRKQREVEERIFKLEEIRTKTRLLLENISKRKHNLLWSRKEHKHFTQKIQQQFGSLIKENAQKLDRAKRELAEIQEQISIIKNKRKKAITFAILGIAILFFGFFAFLQQPAITGYSIIEQSGIFTNNSLNGTTGTITNGTIIIPVIGNNTYLQDQGIGIIPIINESRIARWFMNGSFMKSRRDKPSLPEGWFIQSGGQSEEDNGCVNLSSWQLSTESYSEKRSIMYTPSVDPYACGIKLPSFTPEIGRNYTIEFYFKENFTNVDSSLELLNSGDADCDIKFNTQLIVEERGCDAEIQNITAGNLTLEWKKMSISWPVLKGETADLFFTPPYALNDSGSIIVESFTIKEEER